MRKAIKLNSKNDCILLGFVFLVGQNEKKRKANKIKLLKIYKTLNLNILPLSRI